jgi:hypothetical protein
MTTAPFRQQLEDFHAKLTRRAEAVVRDTVLQLGYALVERSPWGRWEMWGHYWQSRKPIDRAPFYKPGLFKGSWDYDFDAPPSARLNSIDVSGGTSMVRINAARTTPAFVTHYIVNNTEYAMVMEYGGAFHNVPDPTPPGGMVRVTALEFPSFVKTAMADARKVA